MNAKRQLSDEERIDWIRLARTENIGPITFGRLMQRFGSAGAALDALPDLASRGGNSKSNRIFGRDAAHAEIEAANKHKSRIVAIGERGYPPYLRHVPSAPPLLCAAGNLDLADLDAVAIVGARNASAVGRKFARMLAQRFADAGLLVVSGLARGIDTAAHEAATASRTAAVVAGGIDYMYPPENADLQRAIAKDGLLISEMPIGMAPKAEHFPRRNRIISGIARATVIVEAALNSGSLITARFANEQGREVFAVPGSPLDPRASGTNKLIRDGATLLTSADDVLEALATMHAVTPHSFLESEIHGNPEPEPESAAADREHILSLLSPSPVHVDDLVREAHLDAGIIASVLLELEVAGRATRSAGGMVALLGAEG